MSTRELRERIRSRAKRAGFDLPAELADGLERYYALLAKWNAKINLTSFQLDPGGHDEAIDRLLIEPLVAARHVPAGSQTASTSAPAAARRRFRLASRRRSFSLRMVESKTRKAVFLREAMRELGLGPRDGRDLRFEELLARPELHEGLDLVTIRAVASSRGPWSAFRHF